MIDGAESVVLSERRGRLGLLTLNRPRAINALTHEMVLMMSDALEGWRDDDRVSTVAVVGAGDRGLCAGGDVVSLHRAAVEDDMESAAGFWRDEYRLNASMARYPKPIVAVQDGLVLGGGIGISAHASHRIVTERSRLGLPEVTIGFVPDVGSTWLLARAPGRSGVRVALTADHVGAADAIHLGLADAFIPSERIPALLQGLASEDAATAVAILAENPGDGSLAAMPSAETAAFGEGDAADIVRTLRAIGAGAIAERISTRSPSAVAVTLESLRRARDEPDLETALEREFLVSMNALTAPDFREGVRAQLIEKDRNPRWSPASLDQVDAGFVAAYFAPGPAGALNLDRSPTSKETT